MRELFKNLVFGRIGYANSRITHGDNHIVALTQKGSDLDKARFGEFHSITNNIGYHLPQLLRIASKGANDVEIVLHT